MHAEAVNTLYAAAWGFVAAGIMATSYQLITDVPPSFKLQHGSVVSWLVSLVFTVFVAPYIIMRNAVRGRILTGRPIGWLIGSLIIAGVWSAMSGQAIISFMLAMSAG